MLLLYLISVLSDSDSEFITKLYHKLNKRLLGYAYQLSGDVQWARDSTQHVFLEVMSRSEIFTQKKDDEVDAYCFTIVRNFIFRRIKQNKREEIVDIQELEIADTLNAEDDFLKKLEYTEVKAAVRMLSDDHKMIIAMKYGLNQTHAEIGQAMGISVSSSQNLLAAAIRQLRQILGVTKIK